MKKQSVAQQIGFARLMMKQMHDHSPELLKMLKDLEGLEKSLEQPLLMGEINEDN